MTDRAPPFPTELSPRAELAEIAGLLRAHLEWQQASGSSGLPRGSSAAPSGAANPRGEEPRRVEPLSALPEQVGVPSLSTAASPPIAQGPAFPLPRADGPVPALPGVSRASASSVGPLPAGVSPGLLAGGPTPELSARLESLRLEIVGCQRCRLHEQRTQTVFARGQGTSGICFVGEGPGADEDAQGLPFVGAAGQLLDRMISAMGLGREEVYVCNIVKCRPPNNRKPAPDEMAACKGFLESQLELLAPKVMVALGATAVEGLFGPTEGITKLRGRWKTWKGKVTVMPTFHPAYLLRNPAAKKDVWEDLQKVLVQVGRSAPSRK